MESLLEIVYDAFLSSQIVSSDARSNGTFQVIANSLLNSTIKIDKKFLNVLQMISGKENGENDMVCLY